MSDLVLNEDQSHLVAASMRPIQVRDSRGNVVGTLSPTWTEDDLKEGDQILETNQHWYGTREVIEHLRRLEK